MRSPRRSLRLPLLLAAAAMAAPASAAADPVNLGKQTFNFSLSEVVQCGSLTVTWYVLTLIAASCARAIRRPKLTKLTHTGKEDKGRTI